MIGGSAPKYRGADENEFGFAPLLRIIWKDLIFLRSRKLGVYVYEDDKNTLGGFIRHKGGRNNDDEGLEGLDKIDSTGVVGAFYRYNFGFMRFKSEVSHDALGQDQGTTIKTSLSSRFPRKKQLVSVSIGTTWASDEHMDTYFGIDARQSSNSGLRQFNASSGFRDVSVGLGSRYILSRHLAISVHLQYLRMIGDAADSPIVKDRGSADQFVVGLGLSYTF